MNIQSNWSFFEVELETIIALAILRYIANLNAYELNMGHEEVFDDFILGVQCTENKWLYMSAQKRLIWTLPYYAHICYTNYNL